VSSLVLALEHLSRQKVPDLPYFPEFYKNGIRRTCPSSGGPQLKRALVCGMGFGGLSAAVIVSRAE